MLSEKTLINIYQDVAESIRKKLQNNEKYNPQVMGYYVQSIPSIIEASEVPSIKNDKGIYLKRKFSNLLYVLNVKGGGLEKNNFKKLITEMEPIPFIGGEFVENKPTENIIESSQQSGFYTYYVKSENDVFFNIGGQWESAQNMLPPLANLNCKFQGFINSVDEAYQNGYYLIVNDEEYRKVFNNWQEVTPNEEDQIIEVTDLPDDIDSNKTYKIREYVDILIKKGTTINSITDLFVITGIKPIIKFPTENIISVTTSPYMYFYYLRNNDIYYHQRNEAGETLFTPLNLLLSSTFKGELEDGGEPLEDGYYVIYKNRYLKANNVVKQFKYKAQDLEVTPSQESQEFSVNGNNYYQNIKIKKVTKDIDSNINPDNIKKGVTILGVKGTFMSGGVDITSNIKIMGNKDDILDTTEHNKLCILSDTSSLAIKVVDKIEGGSEELSTLSEVLPQALYGTICSAYNDNIYIFGGNGTNGRVNTIYKFNCIEKTITTLSATLPTVLSDACCARFNDNIYIFGGYSSNWTDTIFKFNCTTETITTLSVKLPKQLFGLACSIYENNIYIFGGWSGSYSYSIYKFNCSNETITTLSIILPTALHYVCCATYYDNIYLFGGNGSNGRVNTIYKFNCTTETITTLSTTLPQTLYGACCSISDNNIYIFGGYNGNALNTIYKFDCVNETITTLSDTLPNALCFAPCSTYENHIFIFGGGNNSSKRYDTILDFLVSSELTVNNVLIYNANSNYSFDLITDQVTIPIKKVYIGDSNNTAQLANAYLYDETQMGWVNVNTGEVLS